MVRVGMGIQNPDDLTPGFLNHLENSFGRLIIQTRIDQDNPVSISNHAHINRSRDKSCVMGNHLHRGSSPAFFESFHNIIQLGISQYPEENQVANPTSRKGHQQSKHSVHKTGSIQDGEPSLNED